jgi:transcription elongation factor Elf1
MYDTKFAHCDICKRNTIQTVQLTERGTFANCQDCGTLTEAVDVQEKDAEVNLPCNK